MKFITNKELKEPTYLIRDGVVYSEYADVHEFEWKLCDLPGTLGIHALLAIRKNDNRKILVVHQMVSNNTRKFLVGPVDLTTDDAFQLIGAVRQ